MSSLSGLRWSLLVSTRRTAARATDPEEEDGEVVEEPAPFAAEPSRAVTARAGGFLRCLSPSWVIFAG